MLLSEDPRASTNRLKEKYGVRASALRGQHFLTDAGALASMIRAAVLLPDDVVLEVGPGLGVMTRELLVRVKRLAVVELDPLFVHILREEFKEEKHLEIVEGNILKLKIADLVQALHVAGGEYKVITNLPYNISSAFLKKFLTEPPHPRSITVMLQQEVAERLTTTTPLGMLALMCNLYAECKLVARVPANSFVPVPRVNSAVVTLKPYSESAFNKKWGIGRGLAEDVLAFATVAFTSPRRMVCGSLSHKNKELAEHCRNVLSELGQSPESRPAALAPADWVNFWRMMR